MWDVVGQHSWILSTKRQREVSKHCNLKSALWNQDSKMPLYGYIVFFIAKATVRLKESYFEEMFEYGLEKSVWNLTLHILNCSLSQFHKTRQKSQENCRNLIINFQCWLFYPWGCLVSYSTVLSLHFPFLRWPSIKACVISDSLSVFRRIHSYLVMHSLLLAGLDSLVSSSYIFHAVDN